MNNWYRGYFWAALALLLPSIAKLSTAPTAIDAIMFYLVGVATWGTLLSVILFAWSKFRSKKTDSSVRMASNFSDIPHVASATAHVSTAVDEDRIYAAIANEMETGATDKGLWTRLFAECGGDETQLKVLYIKQRAERLIAAEQLRLGQDLPPVESIVPAATEKIASAVHQRTPMSGDDIERIAHAIFFNNIETVKALIATRLDVNIPNENGVTPLLMAKNCERQEIYDLLAKAGAREK